MNPAYSGTNTILIHCCNSYYKSDILYIYYARNSFFIFKARLPVLCVTNLSSGIYLSWAVDRINIIIITVSNNANFEDLQRIILLMLSNTKSVKNYFVPGVAEVMYFT